MADNDNEPELDAKLRQAVAKHAAAGPTLRQALDVTERLRALMSSLANEDRLEVLPCCSAATVGTAAAPLRATTAPA